jgi:hypothetical protein
VLSVPSQCASLTAYRAPRHYWRPRGIEGEGTRDEQIDIAMEGKLFLFDGAI